MKALLDLLMLRPHGHNLCSRKADIWLHLFRINILLILTAEGLAWGFIGYLMGAQTSPWAGAALVGGMIVLLFGGIDAAFIMLDLSPIRSQEQSPAQTALKWREKLAVLLRKYGTGARAGVVLRVVMVMVSLLITSPFLAQLMFSADIASMLKADYDGAVARKATSITAEYDRKLGGLHEERVRTGSDYSREIAGIGLSRRYGNGPVARSLEISLARIDRDLAKVAAEKQAKLLALRSSNQESRAQNFGIPGITDGIAARFNAFGRIEQIRGFRLAENVIRVILSFFFIGLILLKWYEPRALVIYLDEDLQDAFELYQAGAYDHWHDREKLPASEMTPFAFHRWYYKSEKVRAKTQEIKDRMAAISSRQDDIDAAVRRLSDQPGEDMQALTKARLVRLLELEAADEELKRLQQQSSEFDTELALCEGELRDASKTIANEPRFSASVVLLRKKETWEQRQAKADAAARLHQDKLQKAVVRRDGKAAELERLDGVIAAQNAVMAELAQAVTEARRDALRDLRSA